MSEIKTVPFLPLRGMMLFPYMMVHLDVGREASINALEKAMLDDKLVFLSAQKDPDEDQPDMESIYQVGSVAEIKQLLKLPSGAVRVLVEGLFRGKLLNYESKDGCTIVDVECFEDEENSSMELEALARSVVGKFENWVKLSKRIPSDAIVSVSIISNAGRLADLITSHLNITLEARQSILECINVKERLEKLYGILVREIEIQEIERKIGNRVKKQIEKLQKDHYLHEQIRAIKKELGDSDDNSDDAEMFRKRLNEGDYPEEVVKIVKKEIGRFERANASSGESGVIYNYLDNVLSLPWNIRTEDHIDISAASKVLEKDHYGLKKVKERILEYLAVRKLSPDMKAPIICLVGPPGVGKTSLAGSIARAVGRKFVRASLGGVRDEAEIRGHRRTYIGSMPGRILEAMKKAGSRNPVFLLDEVDKMAADYKGDPTSALLEVLDPEQNNTFSDHYIEIPFDLSDVLWIITANSLGDIPRPLRDRMEIITLSSYTEDEKLEIAKRYLVARQRKENGLDAKQVKFGTGVIQKIIAEYTREAGVRELERIIGRACRRAARKIVENEVESVSITTKNLLEYVDKPAFPHRKADKKPEIGICTGMAWTQVGGDILPTEVNVFAGRGNFILTGKLGDVMKESAKAAMSYIRTREEKLGLKRGFHSKLDIHIHFPEGAIPKDGPSAGITMATALVSALTKRKVRSDVAMTGEITIRGSVLAIGGLKEKVLAAYREGMKTIILPFDNKRDIEEIPENVREKLEFVPVKHIDEVLKVALLPADEETETELEALNKILDEPCEKEINSIDEKSTDKNEVEPSE